MNPRTLLVLLAVAGSLALVHHPGDAQACTVGCAMGAATEDGRPLAWKNRDGGSSRPRHYVMLRAVGTHDFLGIGPDDESPKMGVNAVGLALANASTSAFETEGWDYAHHQALKNFILSELSTVEEVRDALVAVTGGTADYWPTPVSLMSAFADAQGAASFFEIGGDVFFEYDPVDPARLEQSPYPFVARDNTAHLRSDHLDGDGGSRYDATVTNMESCAAGGGINLSDMFEVVARQGHPGFQNGPSNDRTIATMVAHGVFPGEDPRIVTMWVALGNPDYSVFVPTWVAIGHDLSPRVASNDSGASLSGVSEGLFAMRQDETYDDYINALLVPMERAFVEVVQTARLRWLRDGFVVEDAARIHHEAAETAWATMAVMRGGSGRDLDIPPVISELRYEADGLSVQLSAEVSDPDGDVAEVAWELGDGNGATSASITHTYSDAGTYLIRCRATDDLGARSSRWMYVEVAQSEPAVTEPDEAPSSDSDQATPALEEESPEAIRAPATELVVSCSTVAADSLAILPWGLLVVLLRASRRRRRMGSVSRRPVP